MEKYLRYVSLKVFFKRCGYIQFTRLIKLKDDKVEGCPRSDHVQKQILSGKKIIDLILLRWYETRFLAI